MKSYCKGLVISRELVRRAYETWLTKPSGKKNGWRVAKEYGSADALVDEILWEVTLRTLEFRPIKRYRHREPTNGKIRIIGVESVKQQVCDYVAILALEPLLKAKIGFYQAAAVEGKGQKLCRGALRRWSRGAVYHVKADVRKCYPSIKIDVVMALLRKYVKSADVLYVCECLLGTYDGGLEIGSYFSLQMAQLILSFAYHHIEGLGRRRRGRWIPLVTHQVWHMDDFVLISTSKSYLRQAMKSAERYMRNVLGVTLKLWKLARTSRKEPLDLGGWIVRELPRKDGTMRTRVTLRAGIFLRSTRAFARFTKRKSLARARRCASYWGWLRHADCNVVMTDRHIGKTFSRARRMVSAHDRMGARNGNTKDIQGD